MQMCQARITYFHHSTPTGKVIKIIGCKRILIDLMTGMKRI